MASMEILDTSTGVIRIATTADLGSGGGGGGGGGGTDRELVVTTYRVKTAFTGASVGDTVTATQIIDVSGTPNTVGTVWRNQTTATDLAGAPSAANIELVGSNALTDGQLRATPVNTTDKNGEGAVVYITNTAAVTGLNARQVMCLTTTVFSTFTRTGATGSITGLTLPAGTLLTGPVTAITLTSGAVAAYA